MQAVGRVQPRVRTRRCVCQTAPESTGHQQVVHVSVGLDAGGHGGDKVNGRRPPGPQGRRLLVGPEPLGVDQPCVAAQHGPCSRGRGIAHVCSAHARHIDHGSKEGPMVRGQHHQVRKRPGVQRVEP
uniref:Uncharacterized protein n=1 Tax=Human herpesvirus 1 TaxID=10298 RepID=A0A8E4PM86_HHV1|nr:hypothetical protein HSV-1_89 [Human alphaherpesvirus 1]